MCWANFLIDYIDDILIYLPFLESHVNIVKQVLSHLMENQLYVKGKRCKLHTVAFLSKKLTLAEQNYDVGNHELLAFKLALKNDITSWRGPLTHSQFSLTITT